MTNRRKSVNNLISAAFGQALAMVVGFMLPRIVITNFGSEVNGLIGSINQILVYLGLFEAGVGAVALQALYGPVARKDWSGINGVLSATNVYYKRTGLFYLIALAMLSAVYPLIIEIDLAYAAVALIIFFSGLSTVISFFVQGKYILFLKAEGKTYIITNLAALVTVLVGLAKAALILLGYNILLVIIVSFFIHLVQVAYISGYIRKHYGSISVDSKPDYGAISQKNYMLVHQISGLIFQNTDVIILTAASGLRVVSVYLIYKLVMSQMGNLMYIVQSSFDFVLGQTYQMDLAKYIKRIDVFESYFSALAYAAYAVIFLVLYPFIRLYTQGVTDINYADKTLVILFVLIELLTVMRMPMLQTINYAGHFKKTTPQSVAESLVNLTVSLIAVIRFGIFGVLAGTIIALLYRTNDIIMYANQKLLGRNPWHTYLIHLINIAVFILVQVLFSRLFGAISTYPELIITSLLAALIALPLFFSVQTMIWRDNRQRVCMLVKARFH